MTVVNEELDLYLRVREREGRLYSDEIVRRLPSIPPDHPLHAEWRARTASTDSLTAYLACLPKPLTILELGCGNGWLSHRIVMASDSIVVGLDRDGPELRQARRVFAHHEKLSWIAADIFRPPFAGGEFDVLVIASAIQYFGHLPELIDALFQVISRRGEIHILDSPLYAPEDLPAARDRSRAYYRQLGVPEMSTHYHHHSRSALDAYNPLWLYDPRGSKNKAMRSQDSPSPREKGEFCPPFPWICLRNYR